MNRSRENRCFRRFQEKRDPRMLAKVFDWTAPELLRVAGHLANGDRELVEEVLQATFLTAIEDADRYDPSRDVRPWLLGILANHVRKERRRKLKQRGQDATEAMLQASDSPVADAQSAELDAASRKAMQELPSPFREAIVLHLQHGLSAKEIGEALQRPAGTVRTQIVRGMERLRGLLPVGFGVAALGVLVTPGPILAAVRKKVLASLPVGAIGSSSLILSGWRLYAMMTAGVLLVVSMVMAAWSPSDLEPQVPTGVVTMDGDEDVERVDTASRELANEASERVEAAAAQDEPPPILDPTVPVTFEIVRKRDGQPVANAQIGMIVNGVHQQWQADEQGKLKIRLPFPGFYEAYVLGTRARTMWVWPAFSRKPGEEVQRLTVDDGRTLELEVVDAGGTPIAGALVESSCGGRLAYRLHAMGQTDSEGRLVRHDLATGAIRVSAPGLAPSDLIYLNGRPGEVFRRKVTLDKAGLMASGMVRDEDGKPIANAQLALVQLRSHPMDPQFFTSGPDGKFALDSLIAGRHAIVGEHRGEEVRRGQLRFEHDGSVAPQLELRLTRGASVAGRLTDANGDGVGNERVYARGAAEAIGHLPFHESSTTTLADGTFRLDSLAPGSYRLEAEQVAARVVELRDGEAMTWNPHQSPLRAVAVRVLDHAGRPLSDCSVSLIKPGESWVSSGTKTDEDGRLQLLRKWEFPEGSAFRLGIHLPLDKTAEARHNKLTMPNLVTPPLLVGIEHEIRVAARAATSHSLVGTVVDHDGVAITGVVASLSMTTGYWGSYKADVDDSGTFRFEEVPPGRYDISLTIPGRPKFVLPTMNVADDPLQSLGRIVVPKTGHIVARVADDADSQGLKLHLVDDQGRQVPMKRQADGSWRSNTTYFGSYELRGRSTSAWGAKSVQLNRESVDATLTLRPHEATRVTVQLPVDHDRSQVGWSGTLRAVVNGRTVSDHRLNHYYYGRFTDRMEFLVMLPPGPIDLRITAQNDLRGTTSMRVPAGGGGAVEVNVQ